MAVIAMTAKCLRYLIHSQEPLWIVSTAHTVVATVYKAQRVSRIAKSELS